jgi:UDP-N-acetylmuramoyl-tripeptide--D-alanyl-D-alanine ligase
VVTTVGYDHGRAYGVPYVAAPDAIALEKGKLVAAVGPSGLVCLNADDARVAAMAARTAARVVTFGRSEKADLRAVDVAARWPERLHFTLLVDGRSYPVRTRFVGTIMLPSVLAALAVVHGTGRDPQRAIDALATAEPARRHMNIVTGENSGRSYVLDIEKSSLWSTELLVDDIDNIGGKGTLFVLGEMSDMRSGKTRHYMRLARRLASRVDRVILTGQAASAERNAREEGLDNVFVAATASEVAKLVAAGSESLVLLKCKAGSDLAQVIPLVEESGTHAH